SMLPDRSITKHKFSGVLADPPPMPTPGETPAAVSSSKNCSLAGPFAIEASRPEMISTIKAFPAGTAVMAVVFSGSNPCIARVRLGSAPGGIPSWVRFGSESGGWPSWVRLGSTDGGIPNWVLLGSDIKAQIKGRPLPESECHRLLRRRRDELRQSQPSG